jgi:hypothetical protein
MHMKVMMAVNMARPYSGFFQLFKLSVDFRVKLHLQTGPAVFDPRTRRFFFEIPSHIDKIGYLRMRENAFTITECHMEPYRKSAPASGDTHRFIKSFLACHDARRAQNSSVMRFGDSQVHRGRSPEIIGHDYGASFRTPCHFACSTSFATTMKKNIG